MEKWLYSEVYVRGEGANSPLLELPWYESNEAVEAPARSRRRRSGRSIGSSDVYSEPYVATEAKVARLWRSLLDARERLSESSLREETTTAPYWLLR